MFEEAETQHACGSRIAVAREQETASAMTSIPNSDADPQEIEAALAEPGLAAAVASGAPLLLAAGAPAKVVFANEAMLRLFGAGDQDALTGRLFASPDPGARRLADLSQSLSTNTPPRLERLRFYLGRRAEVLTLTCRRAGGFFVVAAGSLQPLRASGVSAAATLAESPVPLESVAVEECSVAEPGSVDDVPDAEPVAPVGPASKSAEEVGRELAARFGGAKSIRFLWQTGPDRSFTKITGQLYEAVGQSAGDLLGQDFGAVAARLRLDPGGRLQEVLARSDTWSGVQVLWPVEGAAAALPILLGALPAFDRQRQFEGFRGFGVIQVEPVEWAVPAETELEEAAEAVPAAIVPVEPPSVSAPSIEAVSTPSQPLETPPVSSLGQNVVALRPYQSLARAALSVVREDDAPLAPTLAPESPATPGDDGNAGLSSDEKLAFHEIGRAIASHVATEHEAPVSLPVDELAEDFSPEIALEPADADAAAELPPAEERAPSLTEAPAAHNFSALFDRLPVGLLVSRFGLPIFVNRTLLGWLDFPDTETFLVGGGLAHMFGGDPAARLGDEASDRTLTLNTSHGNPVPVEGRLQTIEWDGAAATLMTLRRIDSTDEMSRLATLETDLRRSERDARELRAILDTATDGVAVLDGEGRILSLNRSAEALFGCDQKEVAGESFTFLLAKESHAAAADYLAGLKSNHVASLLNDGREVVGRARRGGAIPLFLALGRIGSDAESKFCAVLRDVTQWKKAERELSNARRDAERASALKSDFLAKVSHEIRTPLNAILGFAEVITEERFGPIGNDRYKDYLKDIHASGTHVMSLVNDLLDLSKIEAGKLDLDFAHVDANRIVSECVALMQPQANRERVIVRLSLAPRLPQIVADERSMRQIILNILSNAIKYNEPGGQVIVSTTLTDSGQAVIRIRDTGIGMSESDVITALEPFRQLATSRNTTGTGLGLPLTKALVEANRAHFSIKSKKTEGTLVEVAFPPTRVLAAE